MKTHECPDTKVCSKCKAEKPLSEFYFHRKRNHFDARCKPCAISQAANRAKRKAKEIAEYQKEYRERNKDKLKLEKREWYERTRSNQLKQRKTNYEAKRAEYIYRARKRDRQIKEATPPWCDMDLVRKIYEEAKRLSELTGEPYEVDHIIPLFGKGVRGLHTQHNLRAVPKAINRRKHNTLVEDIV